MGKGKSVVMSDMECFIFFNVSVHYINIFMPQNLRNHQNDMQFTE
jgi:hypothetical protein